MPRTGRPKAELIVTDDEREMLQRWARRRKSSQALALRSRIVLACAEGLDNKTVAAQLGCAGVTVGKWRSRFVALGVDGLLDEPRVGRPPTISGDQVEDVVVTTLESTPANATHWSRAKTWQTRPGCRNRPSAGSGVRSSSSHTARTGSNSPTTRSSWRRSMTSSACICARPSPRLCSVWTRSRRSRRWPGRSQPYR